MEYIIELAIIVGALVVIVQMNRSAAQKRALNSCLVQAETYGMKTFRYKGKLYDKEKYLSYVMRMYIGKNMTKEKVQKLIAKKETQGTNDEMNALEIEALQRMLKNYK